MFQFNQIDKAQESLNQEILGRQNMSIQKKEENNGDTFVLSEKPISIHRRVFVSNIGGIPVIREVVVIETEASLTRIIGIFLSGLIYAIIFQIIISLWERYHAKSCKISITFVLFLFPPLFAIYYGDILFSALCLFYNLLILKTVIECLRKPIRSHTPKKTYKMFKALFRITYIGSFISYILLFIGFFCSKPRLLAISLMLMFTSYYFGLLTREAIQFLSEKMATNIGFYSKDGVPKRIMVQDLCAICGDITNEKPLENKETKNLILTLKCGHRFHVECIKGWLFMGKKGFCPCCRENVDLEGIRVDFWEKGENMYTNFLDLMRKMLVFISMFVIMLIFYRIKKKVVHH